MKYQNSDLVMFTGVFLSFILKKKQVLGRQIWWQVDQS